MIEKFLFMAAVAAAAWYLLRRPSVRPRVDEAAARDILGVGPAADADAIRAAHRRLVAAVHPDRGGSADLTRQINAARDALLKSRA